MTSLKCKEILCISYSTLLFISGLLLIMASSYLTYQIFRHNKFVPSGCVGPFILLFILGFVHLLLTWLGIKGPAREHDFHIILFMIITLVLLIGECAIGVWTMVLWGETTAVSTELMAVSFTKMVQENTIKKEWLKLQADFTCCGLSGSNDYTYKASCTNTAYVNSTVIEGCKTPFIRYVKSILVDGAIMGFLSTILQGLGLFAFFVYLKSLREERSERVNRRLAIQREVSAPNQPIVRHEANNAATTQAQSTTPLTSQSA